MDLHTMAFIGGSQCFSCLHHGYCLVLQLLYGKMQSQPGQILLAPYSDIVLLFLLDQKSP